MNDKGITNISKSLKRLRLRLGVSQKVFGGQLGVTDKAVSKWENGTAMPTIDNFIRMRQLWGVSLDELIQDASRSKQVSMIVLTGGPCAGKSTAASWIERTFVKNGYRVLFIPETATELISAGLAPWNMVSNLDYQVGQFKLQLEKEAVFQKAAQRVNEDKVLIVCDRGLMDNCVYMSQADLQIVLQQTGISAVEARDRYDAVFHLVTAAKGAEAHYTTTNNEARRESPEEAAALDDRIIAAWTGHPHLRVIDNSTDFESKMRQLIHEISVFLGEPEPYEIERKFLIKRPDIKLLDAMDNCTCVEILQTYLNAPEGIELRLRQRGHGGDYVYSMTEKRRVSDLKRIETEQRITRKEYLKHLMNADQSRMPIRKTRYCLVYDNQYLEIDIYPFWSDVAILEVELNDESQDVSVPEFLKVIADVTDDERFKNHSLAACHDIEGVR